MNHRWFRVKVGSCDGKACRGALQATDGAIQENHKKAECRPDCLINNRLSTVVPTDSVIIELLVWVSQEENQSSVKNSETEATEEAVRKKNSK